MGTNINTGISATRFPSHQLSNGLYVSGHPEQYKDKQPTMSSTAVPYTGGDIRKSGELGKMFDIAVDAPKMKKSGTFQKSLSSGASHSGPLNAGGAPRTSGPLNTSGLSRANTTVGNTQGSKSGPLSAGNLSRQVSQTGLSNRSGDLAVGPNPKAASSSGNVKNSGPLTSGVAPGVGVVRTNSGNLIPATGLITSGPISSGPLSSTGAVKKSASGPLDSVGAPAKLGSINHNQAVSNLSHAEEYSFNRGFPKVILWTVIPLFIVGFIAGGFIVATVHNAILLIVVAALFSGVCLLLTWNTCCGKRSVLDFLASYRDADLRNAQDGQYVKVTGVVTCGSVPLESSYQKVNRCVYSSTGLYEYRGWKSKPARVGHRLFTWGLRHLERHVGDFYISDFQSGFRALVKAGYGAHVTPCVEECTVVDIGPRNKDLPLDFVRWLGERNLSSDDRVMQLKEGYIKEGSTVTVMGVVQRHDNVLMIVPPRERVSTGCQWGKFLLPGNLEGLILACDETSKFDGIPL